MSSKNSCVSRISSKGQCPAAVTPHSIQSPIPVVFQLSYVLQNGAFRRCRKRKRRRLLVWQTKDWGRSVDVFGARFVSTAANISLVTRPLPSRVVRKAPREVIVEALNIRYDASASVGMVSTVKCSGDFGYCQTRKEFLRLWGTTVLAGWAGGLLTLCGIHIYKECCGGTTGGGGNTSPGDLSLVGGGLGGGGCGGGGGSGGMG